jgi:[NiFe] hydrogenase diaphorase moiety large subunit
MTDRRPLAPDDAAGPLVDAALARHGHDPHRLLQLLRELQDTTCWLPRPLLARVARGLRLPFARVLGVASAYRFLHLEPAARWELLVSDGLTDRMAGSEALTRALCGALGVSLGVVRDDGHVRVARTSCTGLCDQGPALLVNHHHVVTRLDADRVRRLAALVNADVPIATWPAAWCQVDDVVRRADLLLGSVERRGDALAAALARTPEALLDALATSRLRGRGGAGFPVAAKWRRCREAGGRDRVVVCNADEGEPGTFKDRVLLAQRAESLFDGMTLAAWAIGASRGFLYLRGEYRFLLRPLEDALAARRADGLLGRDILGREGFGFDIELHLGAGAYVCGEETALLDSLEGGRGTPRVRPPFPAESGWRGLPTIVNNAETFVAAAHVARHGAEAWARIGTAESAGTMLHAVAGDCARPGVYEFPCGVRVADVLDACGAAGAQAVQVGGPSGTLLAPHEFGRRIAFEDVRSTGAFTVIGPDRDLFEVARHFTHFFAHESCGFCTPCRVGTALLARRMDAIAAGRGSAHDLHMLRELDRLLHTGSHCGLGVTAANPVRDTLAKFPSAYERRLASRESLPLFDLEAARSPARTLRDVAATGAGVPAIGSARA